MSKGRITKEHILSQAFELASRDGLESLTIGGLAKQCGLSKSGLFAHFNAKTNLQVAVVEYADITFQRRVINPVRELQYQYSRVKINHLIDNWMRWNQSFQGSCMFIDAWRDSRQDDLQTSLRSTIYRWIGYLTIQIEKGIEAGEFEPNLDPRQAAFELYGQYLSAHVFYSLVGEKESSQRFWKSVERLMDSWMNDSRD
ncbi:transcriptional regulator [Vibrio sp. 10N.286.49.C2]|uniref:TetR/AcrR family transcriptional regulator n=1 Tax=unclassified Vibrio TaxID=2614977 RepID=UPI000C84D5C5|nr:MULTISPECIES: helix-turn-helix domain-containing protein [unclassified Vibrio]PMH35178.1 transcriptional regulator [Vibrio sp. 10N.286.49.C2]PMH57121.1 transcriptional regulator [Vibrio sp. 10N.286.49.B1]PMH83591.1 transcriptional regulator [Vibrio sp. 10N.286.48.B7]